ncbi:MAG: S-adenosylmethionine hydrolase [Marivirga sp.]|jgi:S-adenosylmethionine hydrolase
MPIVTFLSDFGWQDHYVAAVKARILSEKPDVQIVDISHNIKKFDIIHASYVLRSVYSDFPKGTIHLIAVNLNNQTLEELIAVSINGHYFLGSNNGLLSLIEEKGATEIIEINAGKGKGIFPAKDSLAPAAVQLANGATLSSLGGALEESKYKHYMPLRIKANRELIQGHVIHIDSYGNLITNINKVDYEILSKEKSVLIKFRNYGLTKVLDYYHETKGGEAFALFNSNGFLEIGIKDGHAAQLLGLEYGSMVTIKFSDY